MVVEFVIILPMLFALFGLIFALGLKVQADSSLDSATRDGARIATQARNYQDAHDAALSAVQAAVGASSDCGKSLTVTVDGGNEDAFQPGTPVVVVASCQYPIRIGAIKITLHPQSTFTSELDVNRGLCPDGQETC